MFIILQSWIQKKVRKKGQFLSTAAAADGEFQKYLFRWTTKPQKDELFVSFLFWYYILVLIAHL
jgi:hypothetical protein